MAARVTERRRTLPVPTKRARRPIGGTPHPFGLRHRGKSVVIDHWVNRPGGGRRVRVSERIAIEDARSTRDGKMFIIISRTNLATQEKTFHEVTSEEYERMAKSVENFMLRRRGKRVGAQAVLEHALLAIAHSAFGI
ncbi:MAG: hypothetical protein Q8P05_05730 [Candidatus Diapherotrites archaeon]|nr:hypothetical protein [Candidatus Diapherotrites archaeon]